ncbi:MAG TPA: hypothetical protein IAA19_01525 [Candidatus Olsenella pullistercoris]|uniref:Uncharacterized protein n=1 Tax=Candidatus Olsenella pullistercoris TaxID=2838712 RepID=A0A9D2EXI8_9ACTN|nr:hypothetical protein [Candidatus Olsenella pullistercoris]
MGASTSSARRLAAERARRSRAASEGTGGARYDETAGEMRTTRGKVVARILSRTQTPT